MQSIKVSIVIPTFNRKDLLKKTLKSLFNQTCPKDKYEIIVCDDGSTDGTEEIVRELIKKSPCVLRYYKQKNRGVASAMNLGISNAKGDIIGFTGDDCIVSPTWIEQAAPYFEDEKIGGIQGIIEAQVDKANKLEKIFKFRYAVTHTEDVDWYAGANMFFRKKAIIEVGCFDLEVVWGEDTDLAYKVKRRGYEILFCEKKNAMIVYHAVTYIGYLKFFKSLKKYEFSALHVKRHPEIRKSFYLGFIMRKQDVYPIFTILTIISAISNINIYFTYTALLISIASYLWGRVFRDSHIGSYPIRIMAFIRNFIIDSLVLYHILRGSLRYRCFIV